MAPLCSPATALPCSSAVLQARARAPSHLALAAHGYRIGGDDVALLNPKSGTIRPVPRCFHLDARSRRLLRNLRLPMPEESLRNAFLTPGISA